MQEIKKEVFSFRTLVQTIRNYFTIKTDEEGAMLEPNGFKWFLLRWQTRESTIIFIYNRFRYNKYIQRIKYWLLKLLLTKQQMKLLISTPYIVDKFYRNWLAPIWTKTYPNDKYRNAYGEFEVEDDE